MHIRSSGVTYRTENSMPIARACLFLFRFAAHLQAPLAMVVGLLLAISSACLAQSSAAPFLDAGNADANIPEPVLGRPHHWRVDCLMSVVPHSCL